MIVSPPFIQASGGGGGGGGLPVPTLSQFTIWNQVAGASAINSGGVQVSVPVVGHGNNGGIAMSYNAGIGSTFTLSFSLTTNISVGATQCYGPAVYVRDLIHGGSTQHPYVDWGISARSGAAVGTYALENDLQAGDPGTGQLNNLGQINSVPTFMQLKFDGSSLFYYYGSDLNSLSLAGQATLAQISNVFINVLGRGLSSGQTFTPGEVGLLMINQDGPPNIVGQPGGTTTFTGFQVTA